jgi:regulator of protease activity HflC (stomatin/prohibitin superfamily)
VRTGGIKFVRGGKIKVCPPGGLYVYWPVITLYEHYPVVRQTDNLRTQTFVTADGKVVSVGGMIVYSVEDIEKAMTLTYSIIHTINDITVTSIHDVCCRLSYPDLTLKQRNRTLDTELKNAAFADLKEYGIKVWKVMLTDLAPCRVLKIVQSVSNDND